MKVFVSRLLPMNLLQPVIDAGCSVDIYEEDCRCPRDELLRRSRDADALLVQALDVIDKEVFDRAPQLKIVATCSIGYDNIDVQAANSRGIIVCNAPAPDLIGATAEAALALLLSVAKRVTRLHLAQRAGDLPRYSVLQTTGLPIRGRASGIIGLGRIGGAIAHIMRLGFDNSILYFGRSAKPKLQETLGAKRCELDELLAESDFVFVTVPLADATRNLLNQNNLDRLRQDAIVINISRAGIIDDKALLQLLIEERIFGAGLDVYQNVAENCDHPNLVLTAHMANGEAQAMRAAVELAVRNIVSVAKDQPLPSRVIYPVKGAPFWNS